jgi:L-fuconate dehydratase
VGDGFIHYFFFLLPSVSNAAGIDYACRFIEEPTAPDDILGHQAIRKALKPYGIGVATGEHAHNRMVFKQLLMSEAFDVVQVDSCRLAGVSEVLSVLLMSAK